MKALAQFNLQQNLNQFIEANPSNIAFDELIPADPAQHKSIPLSFGTFVDHNALSLLISDKKVIRTWPTPNWTLLFVDQTERFAIFEADDSWFMAILDLQTGEWKEDNIGHMLHFSEDGGSIIDKYHSIIHPFPDTL